MPESASGPFPESHHIYQPVSQPATMQQAGQVPCLDQNDAHEQSLGQSDGPLPGPEQTLNQSINQRMQQVPSRMSDSIAELSFDYSLACMNSQLWENVLFQFCVCG